MAKSEKEKRIASLVEFSVNFKVIWDEVFNSLDLT